MLAAAAALRQRGAVLFLGFGALRGDALEAAGRIAAATGAALVAQTTNPVIDRGTGRIQVERLPFALDAALSRLSDVPALVLAGSRAPVAFFARPGQPGQLWPVGCQVTQLFAPHADAAHSLAALCDHLNAGPLASGHGLRAAAHDPSSVGPSWIGQTLATLLPDGAIVIDEALTHGAVIAAATVQAAPHLWLQNMGGSIGYGAPAAIGAALAAPDRPVIALIGDGSAMYTLQALWTQARESLHVITLIIANQAYRILELEAARMGIQTLGPAMARSLRVEGPTLDFVKLAEGMGVPARQVNDAAQLRDALAHGLKARGPMLIQANV